MHFKPLDDLSRCRILLSNDDGIDARGIKLLEQELLKLSNDVWVVAPKNEKSGASHAITSDKLRSMQGHSSVDAFPNDIVKVSERHYAVDGTPSDCVRIALNMILADKKPDLIISSGAAVAVPFFYLGKMMGAKLIYIEVFDRIDKPTMTGKMVYPIVDKFIVQWEEMKKVYPKAVNFGSIF